MRIKGFVESVRLNEVRGWAMDQESPLASLSVKLMRGAAVLAEAVADQEHLGLKRQGTGTGQYAFVFKLPSALDGDARAEITVSAVLDDGSISPALPRYVIQPLASVPAPPVPPEVKGTLPSEIDGEQDKEEPHPLFILGSTRSGTSAIAHALLRRTRYDGAFEGHVFDFLAPINHAVENFYSFKLDILSEISERRGFG